MKWSCTAVFCFFQGCLVKFATRANCFCASLLRTQFIAQYHATSCIERARWENCLSTYRAGSRCVAIQGFIYKLFAQTGTLSVCSNEARFLRFWVTFWTLYLRNEFGDPPNFKASLDQFYLFLIMLLKDNMNRPQWECFWKIQWRSRCRRCSAMNIFCCCCIYFFSFCFCFCF